jgi:hypothetical protein
VRGGNRTVFTNKGTNYRQVWGYFSEPNIKGINRSRLTNKPTYYFGVIGKVNGNQVASDCGIAWENYGGNPGWSLIHRVKVIVPGGAWELWKQSATPNPRFAEGTLGKIHLAYVIFNENDVVLKFASATGKTGETKAWYYNPQFPIEVDTLRRTVGLTQDVTTKEFGKTVTGTETEPIVGKDKNAVVIPNVAAVYLDGSVVKGLGFQVGSLRTAPRGGNAADVAFKDNWSVRGGFDLLRPKMKADGKFIIDFTSPSQPLVGQYGEYRTNYDSENVIITMGAKKKSHKVNTVPKSKKK